MINITVTRKHQYKWHRWSKCRRK